MTFANPLWSLQAQWHQGRLRLWMLVAATALSAAAIGVAAVALNQAQRDEAALQAQLAGARGASQPGAQTAAMAPRDFTAALSPAQPAARLVALVQSAAARAGVTLTSVQAQEHAAAPDRLGRTELALVLQGAYPALKRGLAEALDRIPAATVSRMQWQHADGAADTEARVQLSVWSAPATGGAAPSAARPRP